MFNWVIRNNPNTPFNFITTAPGKTVVVKNKLITTAIKLYYIL